jgi:murein DD-endopeptidase MepM/ murein hydrolase activator NlpD
VAVVAMAATYSLSLVDQVKYARLERENTILESQLVEMNGMVLNLVDQMSVIAERDDAVRSSIYLDPLPEELRKAGIGGSRRDFDREILYLSGETGRLALDTQTRISQLSRESKLELESLMQLEAALAENESFLKGFPSIRPIDPDEHYSRMTSAFGFRNHPIHQARLFHDGNDWFAEEGTPVRATADGLIIATVNDAKGRTTGGLGNYIRIDHGNGYTTLYGHLQGLHGRTIRGRRVSRGDVIGYVGGTGLTTGVHLHYQIHFDGKSVNPWWFYHDDRLADATGIRP